MSRVIIFFCLIFPVHAFAQESDSLQASVTDTVEFKMDTIGIVTQKSFWNDDPHSPTKAALLSLVPGMGQAYNKKYWKIPIVYAGLGVSGYAIWFNAYYYNDIKDAYLIRTDGDSTTTDDYVVTIPSETSLLQYAEYYKKNLDLSVVIFSAVYILNIVDAVVDAHLFSFDISDDLSLQLKPYYNLPLYASNDFRNSNAYGVKLKFTIK
ncbi:MAG: hypothetical protein KA954_10740 [Chitinophagales bacterium]|nr:hypothetical protein [Bacteroidota bacterium]MBP7400054.1 hypothetical protein [Chitinophagales bacterium]MBK8682046.1 hypothetical protein [Bacteroidota bacterium]MBP8754415.1 hypothetical protein [Chitinophagales bacterium]MBP9190205.1 hypothetical protein [Chitinophagales bacterium]